MDHVLGQFNQICDDKSQVNMELEKKIHKKIHGCATNQACATNWNYTVLVYALWSF